MASLSYKTLLKQLQKLAETSDITPNAYVMNHMIDIMRNESMDQVIVDDLLSFRFCKGIVLDSSVLEKYRSSELVQMFPKYDMIDSSGRLFDLKCKHIVEFNSAVKNKKKYCKSCISTCSKIKGINRYKELKLGKSEKVSANIATRKRKLDLSNEQEDCKGYKPRKPLEKFEIPDSVYFDHRDKIYRDKSCGGSKMCTSCPKISSRVLSLRQSLIGGNANSIPNEQFREIYEYFKEYLDKIKDKEHKVIETIRHFATWTKDEIAYILPYKYTVCDLLEINKNCQWVMTKCNSNQCKTCRRLRKNRKQNGRRNSLILPDGRTKGEAKIDAKSKAPLSRLSKEELSIRFQNIQIERLKLTRKERKAFNLTNT